MAQHYDDGPEEGLGKMSTEDQAEKLMKEKEKKKEPEVVENAVKEAVPVTSLGKATSIVSKDENTSSDLVHEIGWMRVKPETLPSQGSFYPNNTDITIRAASAAEIRHWSTIDEEDLLSMDDALNKIMERCSRIKLGGMQGTYKDLKEIDRFYLVFSIRELTFQKGENQLQAPFSCKNCGKHEDEVITKEMISYYKPIPELETRFSPEERCFKLELKTGGVIRLYLPSLGVMNFIKNYLKKKYDSNEEYDEAFVKWAPFVFNDWRAVSEASFTKELQDSFGYGTDKISVLDWFVTRMKETVNPVLTHTCSVCGTEVSAPLNFQGGIKSLFLISDISSKLL